jgi:ornithine cyclodeaminase/alanine dehydrogenase-like protein (mu-crystallin family)
MRVFSMDPKEVQQAFAKSVSEQAGVPVELASSTQDLVQSVDILALATTASRPIIDGDWFQPGLHVNAIGSHAVGVRELDTKSVVRSKIICDSVSACLAEAGDIQIPLEEGAITESHLFGELGELVTGTKKGRANDQEITLFKSVGLSIQDISTAYHVYQKALEKGVGTDFDF